MNGNAPSPPFDKLTAGRPSPRGRGSEVSLHFESEVRLRGLDAPYVSHAHADPLARVPRVGMAPGTKLN
jgi:hypothetical protein